MLKLVFHGPIEIVIGVGFGVVWGVLAQYVPYAKNKNMVFFRLEKAQNTAFGDMSANFTTLPPAFVDILKESFPDCFPLVLGFHVVPSLLVC